MPRRIPIRIKLVAALAVPIGALLLVAAVEYGRSARADRDIVQQTELATASIGPGGIATMLQYERNYGSIWLLGFESQLQMPVTSFDEATAATDAAIEAFRADIDEKSGEVRRAFGEALDDVTAEIRPQRAALRTYTGERGPGNAPMSDRFFGGYTRLVDRLLDPTRQAVLAIDDPALRRGVELTDLATRQTEHMARLTRVLLLAGVSGGLSGPTETADAAGLLGLTEAGAEQVRALGSGRYRPAAARVDEDLASSRFLQLSGTAIATGEVPLAEIMASVSRDDDDGYYGFRTAVNREIEDRADELRADSASTRRWYLALGGVALAAASVVTWLVSRSITRPLRSLTGQAKSMAEDRLPAAVTDILDTPLGDDISVPTVAPIRVNTRDEVSDVADALNTVQDSALDLAVEQAVLRRNIADSFVNLGRRNQNLLGRQLDFITELESSETDADTLADLFRLDHLATRMRRNAESLLVLAGIEPPRKWAAPVRLTDVIRAALGEVEDYQRVTVRAIEPATIVGSAAADLAHLLAELIENALAFSPPDQTVDIRGRARAEDGTGGGYRLAIIDSGLGMPPGDIAAANRRLAGAESFTVAPSKYLGHYVAGNLAARHGITVTLDNSPGHGITGTVDLPPALLADDAEAASAGIPGRGADHTPADAVRPGHLDEPVGVGPSAAAAGRHVASAPPPPEPATPARTASGLVKRSRRPTGPAPLAAVADGPRLANMSTVAPDVPSSSSAPLPPASAGSGARHAVPRNPWTPPGQADRQPDTGPPDRPGPPARLGHGTGARDLPAPPGDAPTGPRNGSTASGLTRRVRGAQLPPTRPLALRRSEEHPSGLPAGYRLDDKNGAHGHTLGNGSTNGHTNEPGDGRTGERTPSLSSGSGDRGIGAVDSVYGFLTSFTQGVQRGLEEAGRDQNGPKENP